MKFGLHLPNAGPGSSAEGILEIVKAAERLSFDSVWMYDHLFTPTGLDSKYPYSREGEYPLSADDPFFDPIGLYGVIAGATDRIGMGTAVLIPTYRNPIVLGKILATIENFAPGRITLGVGAGWMREEFDAVGVAYERRGARLSEYIKALRTIWSNKSSSFDGEFYSWTDAGFLPNPTQPIPIIVGGHSERALRRAAELGDGWAVVTRRDQGYGVEAMGERIDLVNSYRAEAGRADEPFEFEVSHALWFSDQPNPKLPFTGPPDAIASSIKQLEDMGVGTIDLMVFGPPQVIIENAERFSEEVRASL
jgi:probable F420-dependent oxidoreductase